MRRSSPSVKRCRVGRPTTSSLDKRSMRTFAAGLVLCALTVTFSTDVSGQQGYTHGQSVAPVYEGWEENPDGSFNLVFGFYNRNCEEFPHIPIGPDNHIEPGGPDRGQPATFYPRRGWFIFRVQVPSDFGDNEVVWTLTSQGSTERAYATLNPEYVLSKRITMMNEGGFGQRAGEGDNLPPVLTVDGSTTRRVSVGQPLSLTAAASDDGLPPPHPGQEDSAAAGLLVGWSVYRGDPDDVTFDPEQFHPDLRNRTPRGTACKRPIATPDWARERLGADGTFTATATFATPGRYMLRAMAHDGGLKTTKEITVTVTE